MSAQPDRRAMVVESDGAGGYFLTLPPEPLSEEELRWLGLVLIPAALPPMAVPGLDRG